MLKKCIFKAVKNAFGTGDGDITADPQFVDFENNNFNLKDTSPAYKIGFNKIDTSDVGVIRNK